MRGRAARLRWLGLAILALLPARVWANAAPGAVVPLGPIISAVSADGFSVNIGNLDGAALPAELEVRAANGGVPLLQRTARPALWHDLRVTGLLPSRRYRYRLTLAGQPPVEGEVATAPPAGAALPLTLVVFGDERAMDSGVSPHAATVASAVLSEDPDLVLGTGDLLMAGGDVRGWREVSAAHRELFAQVPYFPALGNHEILNDPEARTFRALFPQAARRFYALRYGQILLVVLDSNRAASPEQQRFLEWSLQAAAREPGVRRRFVLMHHAPLSVGPHCGAWQEMGPWMALFERYKVDAVFAGHDHAYQRAERNGVAYLVSGGGGAPLYERAACPDVDEAAVQVYQAAYHYLLVQIDAAGVVTTRARSPQGPPFDAVTLPLPRASAPPLPPRSVLPLRPEWARRLRYAALGLLVLLVPVALSLGVAWARARRRGA